jgi:hypothetical protein
MQYFFVIVIVIYFTLYYIYFISILSIICRLELTGFWNNNLDIVILEFSNPSDFEKLLLTDDAQSSNTHRFKAKKSRCNKISL